MRTLPLLLLTPLALFMVACSESPPHVTAYEITSGKSAPSFYELLTAHADISLSGRELTLKRKDGDTNWLLGNQVYVVKDGEAFQTVDHHHIVTFTLLLHASGDVILSYQARHHPPGMDHPELDTGCLVIPKSFVRVP